MPVRLFGTTWDYASILFAEDESPQRFCYESTYCYLKDLLVADGLEKDLVCTQANRDKRQSLYRIDGRERSGCSRLMK